MWDDWTSQQRRVDHLLHPQYSGPSNKSLSLGTHFTEEEATRRIKEWCVAGMALKDEELDALVS